MPEETSLAPSRIQSRFEQATFALFLAAFLAVCVRTLFSVGPRANGFVDAGLLLAAAATLLVSISTTLPFQNVLLAFALAGLLGGLTHALSSLTGIPFGTIVFTSAAGPRIFGIVSWSIPLIWIVLLFASRGTARVLLRPWRQTTNYGFKAAGMTTALAAILAFGFEVYATQDRRYWFWENINSLNYHGVPGSCFPGWITTALLLNSLATAFLINKKPAESAPPTSPLIVWILLNLLFGAFALMRQFWFAGSLALVAAIAVTVTSGLIHRQSRASVPDGA